MPKIVYDPLVAETSQRLYGLNALIELIYRATPEVEFQEREALKKLAERESWEFPDYSTEDQFLDVKFREELPKVSAYAILILLSSVVETQLVAYARRLGREKISTFDVNDLKGSVLDRTALYAKRVSGLELTNNRYWKVLRDLQDLRDIIVHRAGKPGEDRSKQVEQISKTYPGISLGDNPYLISAEPEIRISIHSCRYFLGEIEQFFKSVFSDANLPVRTGLWPNVESAST